MANDKFRRLNEGRVFIVGYTYFIRLNRMYHVGGDCVVHESRIATHIHRNPQAFGLDRSSYHTLYYPKKLNIPKEHEMRKL